MPSSKPVWERRAWAASFPGLSPPGEAEEWAEEAYLVPLGLGGRNIKIRGDALEMKDLVVGRPDMQLWHPAARLTFPIPSASLERELQQRLEAERARLREEAEQRARAEAEAEAERVEQRVRYDQDLGRLRDSVGAERDLARALPHRQALAGLKPLPVTVDQADQRDRHVEQRRR